MRCKNVLTRQKPQDSLPLDPPKGSRLGSAFLEASLRASLSVKRKPIQETFQIKVGRETHFLHLSLLSTAP